MGNVTARVELLGYDALRARLNQAPTAVQVEAVKAIHRQMPLMMAAMHAKVFTPIQQHAFNSIDVFNHQLGTDITAPTQGTDLDKVLFFGGEFGGRKNKKVVYARRSPRGVAHIVRRRTTMQFLPHLGRRGWFMWPTIREWMPKIDKAVAEHAAEAVLR